MTASQSAIRYVVFATFGRPMKCVPLPPTIANGYAIHSTGGTAGIAAPECHARSSPRSAPSAGRGSSYGRRSSRPRPLWRWSDDVLAERGSLISTEAATPRSFSRTSSACLRPGLSTVGHDHHLGPLEQRESASGGGRTCPRRRVAGRDVAGARSESASFSPSAT